MKYCIDCKYYIPDGRERFGFKAKGICAVFPTYTYQSEKHGCGQFKKK